MNYFNYNGKIFKEGTPIISPDNRGLRYGDGIFETLLMINEQLIDEDEHFARLWKGMSVLQFDIPKHFTPEGLQEQIVALAGKNKLTARARIRLSVIRGNGGLYDAQNHLPNYIIQAWSVSENNGAWNSNGMVLGVYDLAKKTTDILSNLKHNNYLPYVLAALHAKNQKWNDAILLNTNARICDTTIANIFLIKDEVVYTPPLSEGCVAGIMRNRVVKRLATGICCPIIEKALSIDELLNADEVFLTNSIYNIRWVQRIADKGYNHKETYKIYSAVMPTIL